MMKIFLCCFQKFNLNHAFCRSEFLREFRQYNFILLLCHKYLALITYHHLLSLKNAFCNRWTRRNWEILGLFITYGQAGLFTYLLVGALQENQVQALEDQLKLIWIFKQSHVFCRSEFLVYSILLT